MMNRSTIEALHQNYHHELDKLTRFYRINDRVIAVFEVGPRWGLGDCETHDKPVMKADVDPYIQLEEKLELDRKEPEIERFFEHGSVDDLTGSELKLYAEYKVMAEAWNKNELAHMPESNASDPRHQRPRRRRTIRRV